MKKILITSMLFIFSVVSAYGGEIVRITNNIHEDDNPIVNAQGHVWWSQHRAGEGSFLMYYNGTNIIEIGKECHYSGDPISATDGNSIVYIKEFPSVPDKYYEVCIFDGENETQITDDNYPKSQVSICNGYIVWMADIPDGIPGGGIHDEIFLYKPGPTLLEVIEAEDMSYHANGMQTGDYWLLWANGVMSEDVEFPETGTYRFEIIARGSLVNSIGPEMEVTIDGVIQDSVFVNTTIPETFVFDVEVTAGTHEFAIGFYNDYYNPGAGLDRNLYVDKTTITLLN